ncbi:MAG: c-type cytochrome [Gemmata sp.]
MNRLVLGCVALLPFALAGCGGPASADALPEAPGSAPAARYQPRTDWMAIQSPTGGPVKWSSARFPPLLSVRLAPNTPDPELATDLLTQAKLKGTKRTVLDPLAYADGVWTQLQADRIARLLGTHFGTPAAPTVRVPGTDVVVASSFVRLDPAAGLGKNLKDARAKLGKAKVKDLEADWKAATEAKEELKLDDAALARGSLVYRRWCVQCHGPNGAGEAAYAIEGGPMPRDYRQGVFKYVTAFPPPNAVKKAGLGAGGKPRRSDLARTVRNGVPGTMMPAFTGLSAGEVEDVVSYVVHLSVRGEVEFATIAKAVRPTFDEEADPYTDGDLDGLFVQHLLAVLANWDVAAKNPIPVPEDPARTPAERIESAVRGFRLYNGEFGCNGCHANYGRTQQLKWDAWATVVQPRNLTLGVYRGGSRGTDLYARIYGGIAPSGMNAFRDRVTGTPPGTPDKIWDIVHFLHALADPADRRAMQMRDSSIKFEQ